MSIDLRAEVDLLVINANNRERITATLHYIIKLITAQLGYMELQPEIANSRLNTTLRDVISRYYANIGKERRYTDVDSLVNGLLERPFYRNADFQKEVSVIKRSAVLFFNKMAVDKKGATKVLTDLKVTARNDGQGQLVVTDEYKMDAAASKPVSAPSAVKTISKVVETSVAVRGRGIAEQGPIKDASTIDIEKGISVPAEKFYQSAVELKNSIKAEALDGDNEDFDNGKGIKISAKEMAAYTDQASGTVSVGDILAESYPLLTWYIMNASYEGEVQRLRSSDATPSSKPSGEAPSESGIFKVPAKIYDSIMSNFK